MDGSTIAAIAALAVAFVALLVACAQAVQQYLVSGQLIRICDSVVYGKMPGQGRRVWEYSQFRFRIVYSIPQISLSRGLWQQSSTRAIPEREHRLPKLSVSKSKANRATIAGEASWVSFIRTVQHASGDSLRYEMVDGDADRCPTDLPVVPMQLSMREVVALGLMAGMQCTDVSFESQSLSMQGSAGTITSSRHPVLGALIHFAPKQPFETHGMRTNNGKLSHDWIMRLLDTMVVAGCRYDQRDRRHYEEDEGLWGRSPSDRSVVQIVQEDAKQAKSEGNEIRRRHQIRRTQSDDTPGERHTISQELTITNKHIDNCKPSVSNDLLRPQDGEWSFSTIIPESRESNDIHDPRDLQESAARPSRKGHLHQTVPYLQRKFRMLIRLHESDSSTSVLPISEPKGEDVGPKIPHLVHGQDKSVPAAAKAENARTKFSTMMRKRNQHHLDKQGLEDYIAEKRQLETSQQGADSGPTTGSSRLLLMSKEHEDDPAHHSNTGQSSLLSQQDSTSDSPRTQYVVDRWQHIFRQRQKQRSRRRSQVDRTDSFGQSRTRQRSGKETENTSAFNGAVQERARTNENTRRSSTWPLNGERSLENVGDHAFSTGMKLQELPRQKRRRDIKTTLSRSGRQYVTDSAHQEDGQSSADEPENIVLHPRHSRSSLHQPSSARDPLDEDPHFRRGRRRNSSLTRRNVVLDHFNGPLSYGNAPIPTASQRSAGARSDPLVDDSPVSHPRKVRMLSPSRSPTTSGDDIHQQNLEFPTSPSHKVAPAKGILREPREKFPEEPNPTREGVAPARLAHGDRSIPREARWTKIDRRLVSPAALEMGDERYEERPEHVIVLRVLTKEEIEVYAMETAQIRGRWLYCTRSLFVFNSSYPSHYLQGAFVQLGKWQAIFFGVPSTAVTRRRRCDRGTEFAGTR